MMIHEYIYFINSKQTSILQYVCTCMCLMQDSDPDVWIPNEISACRSNMAHGLTDMGVVTDKTDE